MDSRDAVQVCKRIHWMCPKIGVVLQPTRRPEPHENALHHCRLQPAQCCVENLSLEMPSRGRKHANRVIFTSFVLVFRIELRWFEPTSVRTNVHKPVPKTHKNQLAQEIERNDPSNPRQIKLSALFLPLPISKECEVACNRNHEFEGMTAMCTPCVQVDCVRQLRPICHATKKCAFVSGLVAHLRCEIT